MNAFNVGDQVVLKANPYDNPMTVTAVVDDGQKVRAWSDTKSKDPNGDWYLAIVLMLASEAASRVWFVSPPWEPKGWM